LPFCSNPHLSKTYNHRKTLYSFPLKTGKLKYAPLGKAKDIVKGFKSLIPLFILNKNNKSDNLGRAVEARYTSVWQLQALQWQKTCTH